MDIILGILGLFVAFVVLCVIAFLLGSAFNRWSWLPFLLAIVVGVLSFCLWTPKIWVSILVALFGYGVLGMIANYARVHGPDGKTPVKCSHCGSYWVDETFRDGNMVGYQCKKCGQAGATIFTKR